MDLFKLILIPLVLAGCQTQTPKGFSEVQLQQLRSEIGSMVSSLDRGKSTELRLEASKDYKRPRQKRLKKKVFKKIVVGRVEWISSSAPEIAFRARIDTGAQSCSVHADNIVEKEIDGDRYVEFTTLDEKAEPHTFLKKVVKMTNVKGTSGVSEKRYVVKMQLTFGQRSLAVNVNLNNRRTLKHRFLVGRNLLLGDYIVDVSQSRLLGDKK